MKSPLVFTCLIAVTVASRMTNLESEWNAWKAKYRKVYYDEREEAVRRDIWMKNWEFVDTHNKEEKAGKHTFTLKMNKFADLEDDEFRKIFLVTAIKNFPNTIGCNQTSIYVTSNNYAPLPDTVDWRTKGYVTPVKDQGHYCGSCWAFSTTGSVEGAHAKATGTLVSLSEQNLMDCCRRDRSCEGGAIQYAFDYIIDNGGIDTEASYPYQARDENVCHFQQKDVGATISGCFDVTPKRDEQALKKAVATVGPISVVMDASLPSFKFYHSGIYQDPMCSSSVLDHGVLAVGYGSERGKDYWLVKNSWGADWGESGYITMSRNNNNNCGIATIPTYPVV